MSTQETVMPNNASNWQVYKRLLVYLKPLKGIFFLSLLGNAIYAAASALMPKSLDYVVTAVENPTDQDRLFVPALIVGIFALRGVGTFLGGYYIAKVGRQIVHTLRTEIFNNILTLPNRFFDGSSSGHLVSKITFNVEQVTGAATNAITITVREGLTVVGLLGVMLYENWKLTLIFIAIGPIIGLVISAVSRRFRKLSQRIMNSMGDVTHVSSEAVSGYRVVRIFGGEAYERERFNQASRYNLVQSLKMELTKSLSTPVVQLLVSFSIAILVWLALAPEVRGNMTAGGFVAFIAAATTMAKPIRQLTSVNATIQSGVTAAKDLFTVIDEETEVDNGSVVAERVKGNIEFKNVSFSYADDKPSVLRDISLSVNEGETIALVGPSGSGKSTLANLLPRFYEPSSGSITLDGANINDYQLSSLRDQIALVTQNVTLFNDTVANNIAYGALAGASEEDIIEAARKAHALEFIEEMPDGIHTLIGDNGVLLSGGQRQRLAIARALLKDAPILILDEATSALDSHSEKLIQDALETVMKGRTTIVIAHRLSTIEGANTIAVIEGGNLVESGSHEALLERGGLYAQLHKLQFSE
ncbi:lipid A export permease/ATP-binding protein MsbA [Alkalimarinus coralli]|uniref:lipid A export permease/ATP-binding protein MsbA n=1 Tax=Alkalimarinus coralli TaxID=2935863 RepID=UPI00202AEC46|nr:lipid A export permease/ATP-binding protein MsbA [Alkalimarinus coralli]